jgi:hypothetical protein
MNKHFQHIIETVEPFEDSFYGSLYRCSLTLKDGTYLPCAVIQSKQKLVELAKRRIREEMDGKGCLGGADPYEQIVLSFVTGGNRINDCDVISATPSHFAIPLALLHQIHGETTMAWTGWVFEMSDGSMFSYGSSFSMKFFQLPDGYSFRDVTKVYNHSYVGKNGKLIPLQQGSFLPDDYKDMPLLRERVYFTCAIESI